MMINLCLYIKSLWRRWHHITRPGPGPDIKGWPLVEYLDATNTYKGFEWAPDDRPYHPDYAVQWFDPACVQITNTQFACSVVNKPRNFNGMLVDWAIGLVQSKAAWQYGYFESMIKMPLKRGQWPADWLTGETNWPPEIDTVEGYSRSDEYRKLRKFQSNVHFMHNGKKRVIRAKDHPIPKGLRGEWVKYATLWLPDKIEWWYNGYLVRRETRRHVLAAMNEPMRRVLNSAVQLPTEESVTLFDHVKVFQHPDHIKPQLKQTRNENSQPIKFKLPNSNF